MNEIGLGTNRVGELNSQLENEIGTKLWKGDLEQFAANGTQEGLFLLPNYELKDSWFPTKHPIKPEPVHGIVETDFGLFIYKYENGIFLTEQL